MKITLKMKKTLIPLFTFLLLCAFACNPVQKETEKVHSNSPNVIFILVDDLGYGDLSFYGQKTLSTPIIDKMANEGIHFTNMCTGSTVCAPSRASLMTGKHTGHTSVRGNMPEQLLGDDELTLAWKQ